MGCPTKVGLDETLKFYITTHDPDTGVSTSASSTPDFWIYDGDTSTALLSGSMVTLDPTNTTGFYVGTASCSTGNGFADGGYYGLYISATVDSDTGAIAYGFRVESKPIGVGVAGSALSAMPWNATWDAEVQSEAQDALTATVGAAGVNLSAIVWNAAWDAEVESEVQDVVGAAGVNLSAVVWNAAWDAEVESEVDDALGVAGSALSAIPWNASWDTEIQSEVQDVTGAGGSLLSAMPWNADWDTEVQSEVNDALIANNLDHLALTATGSADMTTELADSTILSRLFANGDTSAYVPSTDSVQAIRDKLTDIETDTAEIGAAGSALSAVPWNAAWDAEVQSEAQDALTATVGAAGVNLSAIVWNAAWDGEVQSEANDALVANNLDHLALNTTAGTDMTAEVADGTIISRMLTDGNTSDFVSSTYSQKAIRDQQDVLETDTSEIQGELADGGRTDVLIDAIKAKTDNLPGAAARGVELAALQFLMVDLTDGYTAETGISVTAQISKDGGALAACTNSVTEISNGLYKITLTATEMTATTVTLRFTGSGCRNTVMTLLTDT